MNRHVEGNVKTRITTLVLILVLVVSLKSFWDNFSRFKKASSRLEEKERSVESLRKENESIKKRIEELNSDLYIERQLRDNLVMAKEGEVVVILPDDEELEKLVPDFQLEKIQKEKPVWRKWLDVFNF